MKESYIRKPNTACAICKKPIYRRPCEIAKSRVFCGVACYGISNRKESPCMVCGKLILASFKKRTCSRSCANIHRAGIKYNLNRPKDKVKHQRSIKIRLLQESGEECKRCRYAIKEILQIHHRDRNRNNNDLSNLELVCPNCHYEEHFLEKSWLKNGEVAREV